MVRDLLIRGMLAGLVSGLLVFGFAKMVGEPEVDRAIRWETAMDQAKADMHQGWAMAAEGELVSREVQASLGLFTAVVVYSTAFGGLFALVFAFAYRRVGNLSPRAVSALLAAGGFIGLYAVPSLQYPANPPAVGGPETIGLRTEFYFLRMLVSIAAMVAAVVLRTRLAPRYGGWAASLSAAAGYCVVLFVVANFVLPVIDEVPEGFPAVLLWRFRVASLGTQAIMWTSIGLLFGWLTELAITEKLRLPARRYPKAALN